MVGSTSDLRPYYNPDLFDPGYLVIYKPGIGLVNPKDGIPLTKSISPIVNKSGQYNPGGNIGIKTTGLSGISDKNYVYDLELVEYFDLNNLSELLKNLFYNFFKNYLKVLALQPLEMTRLLLQVGTFDFTPKPKSPSNSRLLTKSDETLDIQSDTDSDLDEIKYFQPLTEIENSKPLPSPKPKAPKGLRKSIKRKSKIHPISKHSIDIMTSIIAKDGPNGLFRGINAQFIYQTLSHTIEAWITGFLSPFLGIPDPFFLDLTHLIEPSKSLCLSVLACVLTSIILMPLDLIKVKLIITQFNRHFAENEDMDTDITKSPSKLTVDQSQHFPQPTRSIRESIRHYPIPLLISPPALITFLTVLHQFSTSIFRKSAPYLLFIRYNIDSYLSPRLFTICNLVLLIMEFFIKLPVENLLRKEQVRFLIKPKSLKEDEKRVVTIDNPDEALIVDFNDGWVDPSQGSTSKLSNLSQRFMHLGLFNGWRVGVLNIIGFWGYKIMQSGGVMTEERF